MKNSSILKNRKFVAIFIIAFLIYFSHGMLGQTLPKYAKELGANSQIIGTLSGMFAMCALLIRPVSGQMVDNEDKKLLLRICIGIILIAVIGLSFSKKISYLLFFRGLNGFGWGIGSTLCMTIASSCFPKESLGTGIGIYGLGQTIAQAISPMVALQVVQYKSYNYLYRFNILLTLIAFILTFFIDIGEEIKPRKEIKYSLNLREMISVPAIPPAIITLCNSIAKASISSFLVIFAESISVTGIGIYFTVQALTILAIRPILGRMTDKYGLLKVLIPCELAMAIALITIFFSTQLWHFILAAVLMGAGTAGAQPALMSECLRRVSSEEAGRASNTSYVGTDIGNFTGSNLAGLVVGLFGYRKLYLLFTLPMIISTVIYTFIDLKEESELSKN